jgi:hypothetical protein
MLLLENCWIELAPIIPTLDLFLRGARQATRMLRDKLNPPLEAKKWQFVNVSSVASFYLAPAWEQ